MLAQDEVVTGHLALGVVNSALTGVLPPVLHRLKIETANLQVKIIAGNSAELLAQVENGILDAAIVTQPPKHVISSLCVNHLYSEPYALLLPEPIPYDSLAAAFQSSPYIAFDRHTWAGRQIDDFLHQLGIEVRPEMELNSLDAVTAVVRQGLGITIVPLVRGNLRHLDPLLRVILIPGFNREVCLVQRRNNPQQKLTAQILGAFARLAQVNEYEQGLGST
ncbi:LysR substrate-binding domain-containing protein [Candidimonas nitroreducens]|nr:LysR substrate-binding domain-containing protein [Candidimonas nitroreducens]